MANEINSKTKMNTKDTTDQAQKAPSFTSAFMKGLSKGFGANWDVDNQEQLNKLDKSSEAVTNKLYDMGNNMAGSHKGGKLTSFQDPKTAAMEKSTDYGHRPHLNRKQYEIYKKSLEEAKQLKNPTREDINNIVKKNQNEQDNYVSNITNFSDKEREQYGLDKNNYNEEEGKTYYKCSWCGEPYSSDELKLDKNLGPICHQCEQAIWSHEGKDGLNIDEYHSGEEDIEEWLKHNK